MSSRIARAALLLIAAVASGAPPLTIIQDVLYKADGSRFNGIIVISWSSFDAPDASNITSQALTVKVTDGNLRVQLVPTTTSTPPTYYLAKYNSDGKVQFEETWAVPTSSTALRVRDVRVTASEGLLSGNDSGTSLIQESDVVGLTADLGARPLKSPGYAAGRAVFVNAQGALESVSGSAGDCVRVDGSSGPCRSGLETAFIDSETPAGIVDGNNRIFLLSAAPDPAGSLMLYRNGVLLKVSQDFTLSTGTIAFVPAMTPQPGDTLLAAYRAATSDSGTPQAFPPSQVLCRGVGGSTSGSTPASLGICTIPSGLLTAGGRLEIRLDLAHQGTASGFHFEVHWGATTLIARNGAAGDVDVTVRADAALSSSGTQVSSTSWGTVLPFASTVGNASDVFATGIAIEFLGQLNTAGADALALKNFTIVRFP